MVFEIITLVVSLFVLAKASDYTIRNAVRFSRISGVSQLAVGFVVIAVATSLPELTIAIISSLEGQGTLSLGNVFGSSIANLAWVLGVLAFLGFKISKLDKTETYRIILVTLLLSVFVLALQRIDAAFGAFLLVVFYVSSKTILTDGSAKIKNHGKRNSSGALKYLAYTLVSIAFVVVSANLAVDSALQLANDVGMTAAAIGATIVSIGTTLPEMSVNLAALRKKNVELAIGDSLGSVLTNMTLVLGAATVINPIALGRSATVALISMMVVGIVFALLASRHKFGRLEGSVLLAVYFAYLAVMIVVGRM